MFCQACGANAPSTYVAYYWNIGALLLRWQKAIKGDMCRECVHRYFWEYTLINATLGWWSITSLIVTPFFIVNNLVRYIVALVKVGRSPKPSQPQYVPPAQAQAAPQTEPQTMEAAAAFFLHIGSQALPLHDGHRIELAGQQLAEINRNPNNADVLGLKNISDRNWIVQTPDGTSREIVVGRSIKVAPGTQFNFGLAAGEIR